MVPDAGATTRCSAEQKRQPRLLPLLSLSLRPKPLARALLYRRLEDQSYEAKISFGSILTWEFDCLVYVRCVLSRRRSQGFRSRTLKCLASTWGMGRHQIRPAHNQSLRRLPRAQKQSANGAGGQRNFWSNRLAP